MSEQAEPKTEHARIEALAEKWNSTPDYAPSDYDQGRVDQRHAMTTELLEALNPPPTADRIATGGGVVMGRLLDAMEDASREMRRLESPASHIERILYEHEFQGDDQECLCNTWIVNIAEWRHHVALLMTSGQ